MILSKNILSRHFFPSIFEAIFWTIFPTCVVPKPTTNGHSNANAVPTTNHVNRNELVLKNLALEASQWTNYNWSAIQEAEAKYQIYLASQRKVCKVWFSILLTLFKVDIVEGFVNFRINWTFRLKSFLFFKVKSLFVNRRNSFAILDEWKTC